MTVRKRVRKSDSQESHRQLSLQTTFTLDTIYRDSTFKFKCVNKKNPTRKPGCVGGRQPRCRPEHLHLGALCLTRSNRDSSRGTVSRHSRARAVSDRPPGIRRPPRRPARPGRDRSSRSDYRYAAHRAQRSAAGKSCSSWQSPLLPRVGEHLRIIEP